MRRSVRACKAPDRYEEEVFCICRKGYRRGDFMIACDECDEWYHGDCVGFEEDVRALSKPRSREPPRRSPPRFAFAALPSSRYCPPTHPHAGMCRTFMSRTRATTGVRLVDQPHGICLLRQRASRYYPLHLPHGYKTAVHVSHTCDRHRAGNSSNPRNDVESPGTYLRGSLGSCCHALSDFQP
jgi:hypothetical protein